MTDQCKSLTSRGARCRFMEVVDGRCWLHTTLLLDVVGEIPVPHSQGRGVRASSGRSAALSHDSQEGPTDAHVSPEVVR